MPKNIKIHHLTYFHHQMERRVHMVPWKTFLKGKVAIKSDTLPMCGLIYSISRRFRISTSRPSGLITLVAGPGPTFEAKVLVGPLKSLLLLLCYPNISLSAGCPSVVWHNCQLHQAWRNQLVLCIQETNKLLRPLIRLAVQGGSKALIYLSLIFSIKKMVPT